MKHLYAICSNDGAEMIKKRMMNKCYRAVNNASVSDISQLGNCVVDGYAQYNAGAMPQSMHEDLETLTDTLVEGMTIAFNRLVEAKESPQTQAECELFMDMQRRYCDKIPEYANKAKDLFFDEY